MRMKRCVKRDGMHRNQTLMKSNTQVLFWTTALDAMDEESGTLHKPSKRDIHSFDGEVTTQQKSRFRSKVIIPQISQSMLCGAHKSAEADQRRMEMESVINQR